MTTILNTAKDEALSNETELGWNAMPAYGEQTEIGWKSMPSFTAQAPEVSLGWQAMNPGQAPVDTFWNTVAQG